jgi:hypothetical protein
MSVPQTQGQSEQDQLTEQQTRLYLLARRTSAISVGRGMLTLGTEKPNLTETIKVKKKRK